MRPRAIVSHIIQVVLRSIGVRKLDHQFLLSYTLIFLCALGSASFLYFSTDAGEAKSLNVAGAQRMLSQRVAKEVQMVAAGVEDRTQAQQTIEQWERAHQWLLNGSEEAGVRDVAKQIDDSTTRAADVIGQAQQGVEQQQSDTDQVATAVNEMSATVQEVARNTSETAEASARADDRAGSGQKTLSDAAAMVQALSGRMGELQQLTTRLQEESKEVGTVLSVITDIADQTNLLALNAAIEAARAGEAGRGFAVVADEVHGLARRTQESIGKIGDIVDRFQSGTGEVAKAMLKGQDEAHHGADAMSEAESTLGNKPTALGPRGIISRCVGQSS